MKIVVYTDGGSRGNPGHAGVGWVIQKGDIVTRGSKYLGEQTNNWAEYEAVICALQELKKMIPKDKRRDIDIEVRMDSELVVRQLSGEYQIKEETLFPQFIRIWNIRVSEFPNITFTHIPREENSEADALANEAMDGGTNTLL